MAVVLTTPAFSAFRTGRSVQSINPAVQRYDGDSDQMSAQDGLASWEDGAGDLAVAGAAPDIAVSPANAHLWAVTANDVFHAAEICEFGKAREAGRIKHSNLTGGGQAICGGELVFLDESTIVINGCSGRYRITDPAEMKAVASAFRSSGYNVWSMGWNADVDRPAMFGTQDPEWVAA